MLEPLKLGAVTDSFDRETKRKNTNFSTRLRHIKYQNLFDFIGNTSQIPPVFSCY